MSTVCWWSGSSVPNQGGPTEAPRSSAQILSDLGKKIIIIMVIQKRSSCQDHKCKFHLDTIALEHTKNYTYLGLNISATGNFHKAVNDLRDKARRAFYAIKRKIHFNIPIRIWLKNTWISHRAHCPSWLWGLRSAHQPRPHKMGQTPNWDSARRILQKYPLCTT